jgi:glutaredoxin
VFHRRTCWRGFVRKLGVCCVFVVILSGQGVQAGDPQPDLEVFVRAGCPHCEAAKRFLDELRRERPSLRIAVYDVAEDTAARQRLAMLAVEQGTASSGVPTFLIGTELIVGFFSADTTGAEIRARLARKSTGTTTHPAVGGIQIAWLGELRVNDLGLPFFTVAIGLLDGFNPCAMWVLLFLLSLLVNLRDRQKMALIAGTFIFVSGLVYFVFMAAWLNVFLLIGFSRAAQIGLGGIALVVGAVNVKDFFALHRGISLSIPESAKVGLYARVRRILQAENLTGALIGIAMLAGLVNLVEFLCTAGLPALYTQILTLRNLPWWEYYGYLGLYNLAYMLDDSIMVVVAVVTLTRFKLQERGGRWLKLTSGIVMVSLGSLLLLKPQWLI